MDINSQHVYNLIAKEIREALDESSDTMHTLTLARLGIRFAKRFKDNDDFDPRTFLGRCTPDPFRLNLVMVWDQMEDDGA